MRCLPASASLFRVDGGSDINYNIPLALMSIVVCLLAEEVPPVNEPSKTFGMSSLGWQIMIASAVECDLCAFFYSFYGAAVSSSPDHNFLVRWMIMIWARMFDSVSIRVRGVWRRAKSKACKVAADAWFVSAFAGWREMGPSASTLGKKSSVRDEVLLPPGVRQQLLQSIINSRWQTREAKSWRK